MKRAQYYYAILPDGNQEEFPMIERNLKNLGVPFSISNSRSGGRAYRLTARAVRMLPVWKGKPFLPVETDHKQGGHGVYRLPNTENSIFREMGFGLWQRHI